VPLTIPERARQLIDFWFAPEGDPGRERRRQIWFKSTAEFDAALRERFFADHERAAAGALAAWEAMPESALALLLLLDQVPRNIFRGSPRVYATDREARAVAGRALARGFDQRVPPVWRIFFYLPLMHSEDLVDQRRALELFAALPSDPDHPDARRAARHHYEIIARFGRFPHRNAILGRTATAEEIAFLAEPESSF
jgi:uncharacterized protein (DUF924 family)